MLPLLVTHPLFEFCYPPTSWHLSLSLIVSKYITSVCIKPCFDHIVGKGGHTHTPFSRSNPPPSFLSFLPFYKSKMSPPFRDPSGKQKYWMNLSTDLYINSTYKVSYFGRIFTKNVNCKLDNPFRFFLVNFMKNGYQLEKRI